MLRNKLSLDKSPNEISLSMKYIYHYLLVTKIVWIVNKSQSAFKNNATFIFIRQGRYSEKVCLNL